MAADRGLGAWTAASADSFQFLAEVLTRPEPGTFAAHERADGQLLALEDYMAPTLDVPLGEGAYFESEWDSDAGYHWFDRVSRIGTWWDRMLALQVLTSASPYGFVGFDTAADPRFYAVGVQTTWRDPLSVLLARLVGDDAPAGLTWSAWSSPDETGVELGPAARMIRSGLRLQGRCEDPDVDAMSRDTACAALSAHLDDVRLQAAIHRWVVETGR